MKGSWLQKSLSFIGSTAVAFSMNSGLASCCPGNDKCTRIKSSYCYFERDNGRYIKKEVECCVQCLERENNKLFCELGQHFGYDLTNVESEYYDTFLIGLMRFVEEVGQILLTPNTWRRFVNNDNKFWEIYNKLNANKMLIENKLDEILTVSTGRDRYRQIVAELDVLLGKKSD